MGFEEEIENKYIAFYHKNDGFITIFYTDGTKEYYEDTLENEKIIINIINKQYSNRKNISNKLKRIIKSKRTSKTRNGLIMTLTEMASIISFEESKPVSILLLFVALACGNFYAISKNDYDKETYLRKCFNSQSYYLFYQGIFDSMDFSNKKLYQILTPEEVKLVKENLNKEGKLDINAVLNVPFKVLVTLETNYYNLVKSTSSKAYTLIEKNNKA